MMPVTTAQTTVSMMTAPQRLIGRPSACSVTPEEYMSIVLIDSSWKIAKIRNGVTNQLGNDSGTPIWAIPTVLVVIVYASTPRISRMMDGIAPPSVAAQNVLEPGVFRGRYREESLPFSVQPRPPTEMSTTSAVVHTANDTGLAWKAPRCSRLKVKPASTAKNTMNT